MSLKKTVQGHGVNDADYKIRSTIDGVSVLCPFYMTWRNMLRRCYDPASHKTRPKYAGCSVCDEWLSFISFKSWMTRQDWLNKHLDKDILIPGNKVYGPKTCCFVTPAINGLLLDHGARRGKYPIGVSYYKSRYMAKINISGMQAYLGMFDTAEAAHDCFRAAKARYVRDAAQDQQIDVKTALLKIADNIESDVYYK